MSDLQNIADARGISADGVDFDLLSYQTFFKGTVDEDWQNLRDCDLLERTTESEIRSNIFLIRHEYNIRFREYKPNPHFELRLTIATDKYKSKAVAIIDPKSTIPLKKGVQEWIKEAILKRELRHGLMIGLFDVNLDQEINRLLLKIQKEGLTSADVFEACIKKGLMIRDCSSFQCLDGEFVRFCIMMPEDNTRLLDILKQL